MNLTYFGHGAFGLEADGHRVLVDPFLSGNPAAVTDPGSVTAETILLTHAHNDHVGDTVEIAKRCGSTVIATFELANWIGSQGVKKTIGGNFGGTIPFPGGTAKFVPAWHTSSYSGSDGVVVSGVPAGYVVRCGGKTIYFAGDTGLFLDMQLIGEEGLDVAIIPIGDHFTMGPDDATKAVKMLHPKLVIPGHYNTFPAISQDASSWKKQVESQTDSKVAVMQPGEVIELQGGQ